MLISWYVQAARARCTVEEISMAMEKVFTRHVASDRMVSGAYKSEYGDDEEIQACISRVEVFIYLFIYYDIKTGWLIITNNGGLPWCPAKHNEKQFFFLNNNNDNNNKIMNLNS